MKTATFNLEKIRSLDMRRLLKTLNKALKDDKENLCKGCVNDCRACQINETVREAAAKIELKFKQSTMFGGV